MKMSFQFDLKSGFFQIEKCILKIDSNLSHVIFEINQSNDVYLIEYSNLQKIIFNPHMRNELEFKTKLNDYIGYIHKEDMNRGIIDLLRMEFGDKFKEII